MAKTRLTIPDMTCGHCEGRVKGALTGLDGVKGIHVDLATKAVDLDYDESRITLDRIREVLAEDDYPVETARPL